jgi:hypothetical protein
MTSLLLVGISMFASAGAAMAGQTFECGGAAVEINVSSAGRATVGVSRERHVRELGYLGGIDFVGGHCARSADGRLLVVFQAYCGGSGCKDLDNWGIVDPLSLQVLLAPSDSNRGEAQRILGLVPVRPENMLNLERELGVAGGHGIARAD